MKTRCLSLDEPNNVPGTQLRQINRSGAEALLEEPADERYVVDDRSRCEQPLLAKIPLELQGASLGGRGPARDNNPLGCNHAFCAEVVSQLSQRKRGAVNALSSAPTVSQVLSKMLSLNVRSPYRSPPKPTAEVGCHADPLPERGESISLFDYRSRI